LFIVINHTPQLKATLEQAQTTLASIERLTSSEAPANQDLQQALREIAEVARSRKLAGRAGS
jgi:hypothetical protein